MKYRSVHVDSSEKEWIISFGDFCFDFYGAQTGFSHIMPKLYGPDVDTTNNHIILKDDDCYVGMAGVFPSKYYAFNDTLNYAGIGTVCVHPKYRNQGCMTYILNEINKHLKEQQFDFVFLGGAEARYAHFGFYPCVEANIYEWKLKTSDQNYQFKQLRKEDVADITLCNELYTKKKIRCERTLERFYDIATTWKNKLYSYYKNDEWCGYLIYSDKHQAITEIELSDISHINAILSSFLSYVGKDSIHIELSLYDEKNRILEEFAYFVSNRYVELFQILSYEHVLEVLLKAQMKRKELNEGRLTLKIGDESLFTCVVTKGQVKILEDATTTVDVQLTKKEANMLFLGEYPYDKLPENIKDLCKNWFPLPLFISSSDQV